MVVARRMRPANAAARAGAPPPPPPKKTESRGTGFVRTTMSDRQGTYHDDHKEVEVLREVFDDTDPPAYIKVSAGLTIATAPYESLRIDCAVSLPCKRGSLQKAYELASAFIADRIAEEQTNWLGAPQKSKGK